MKMKTPRTKMNQYTNSKLVVELIELLQDKKMIQVTPNPLYVLMVEKSLMVSHLPKFEHNLNNALRRDNEEEEEEELEGMSDMEKKRHLLNNPRLKKRNLLNFKSLADLIVDKIAILYDYLLTHTTTFNLENDIIETDKTKNVFDLKLGKVLVKKMNTMKIVKMMMNHMKDIWKSTHITASL